MANLLRLNINGSHNPTHLVDAEIAKFKTGWVGQVYYSSYNSNKCGVAILLNKKINFVMLK